MNRLPEATALLASAVWALGAAPVENQRQSPQFRARTELVQVDVVVLDAEGRPVRGLKATDFTILDGRRAQPVQTFTEINHHANDGEAVLRTPSDETVHVADNSTARSQRAIVLVIHDLGLRISRFEQVKDLARRVVRDLGPDASMALLFSSGRGSLEFTEDRAQLLTAIEDFHYRGSVDEGFVRFTKTIEDAARYLTTDQTRRKAIITISEGISGDFLGLFEIMRPRGGQGARDMAMLAMMDALRRANVALYGIDPRGRLRTTEERARESRGMNPVLRMFDKAYHSQQSLDLTAAASGGFAIVDTNDFDAGLRRIVADLDNYYLLGFYPENSSDHRWRDLEVTVNRPGVTVRHRKGYRLGAKPVKPKNKDPMVVLSEGVLPVADLRLRLSATATAVTERSATITVTLELPDLALVAPATAAAAHDRISVTLLAVDLKRRKVVRRVDRTADVTLGAGPAGGAGYEIPMTLDLPPGRYQLRASARSATLGKAGSVYLTLDVSTQREIGSTVR